MKKYDKLELTKFTNELKSKLKFYVGVKTGNLKRSINVLYINKEKILVKWLPYGDYINPWIKKTGVDYYPGGGVKIIDDEIDKLIDLIEVQMVHEIIKNVPKKVIVK